MGFGIVVLSSTKNQEVNRSILISETLYTVYFLLILDLYVFFV